MHSCKDLKFLLGLQVLDVHVELGLVLQLADLLEVCLDFIKLELPGLRLVDVKIEVLKRRNDLLPEPIGVRIHRKVRILLNRSIMAACDESALPNVANNHVQCL